MKIRSVTYFGNPGYPLREDILKQAGEFSRQVQQLFSGSGYEVQTIRFAAPPFPLFLAGLKADQVITYAVNLERVLTTLGYAYFSLGPALPDYPESFLLIPDLIKGTENTFCSGLMTEKGKGVSLQAVRACGEIIQRLAPVDPDGFANLYFAALGNVSPGAPFFPAAYHGNQRTEFAVAVEAADLALAAFSGANSFENARERLITLIEKHGTEISRLSRDLEKITGAAYGGLDYSLAPFPEDQLSIGAALESIGLPALGNHGSLAAAAFLADTIDKAYFQRTGFSGLMLPILEDSRLAKRAAEGLLGIKDMLLYATVCGTGLDTIPLPGDTCSAQISAILFDLAVLSLRLDKPLTARLMPIPGKKAGDPTSFDFPFFANSKVLDLQAEELSGLFQKDGYLDITSRNTQNS